jgi:hypothetical protein
LAQPACVETRGVVRGAGSALTVIAAAAGVAFGL